MTKYTLEEVAKHNQKNSVWILIHHNIYDVSKFLDEHPGGEEVLLQHAGCDATEDFEDIGHSSDARDLMKKYKIGELCDEDKEEIENVEEKINWETPGSDSTEGNSSISWIIAVLVGFFAILLFGLYLY